MKPTLDTSEKKEEEAMSEGEIFFLIIIVIGAVLIVKDNQKANSHLDALLAQVGANRVRLGGAIAPYAFMLCAQHLPTSA